MAQALLIRRGGSGGKPSYPFNVSSFTYTNLDSSVTISWTDPTDSAWAGTKVVAKQGGYPANDNDGTVVVNSTVKNQYSSTGFSSSGWAAGTWYLQAFPYNSDGAVSNNVVNRLTVTVTYVYPSALASFSLTQGNAQATPVFTLPANATGVKLVYKTGSYPTTQTDGTVIASATSGTAITGLTNDVTYYFRAFPFNSYGRYNEETNGNQASVMPQALPAKDTLENTSWANIALVAAAGKAAEYWAVGDTKTITFGSAVLGSTSIVVKIMGFEYDDLADGSGKAKISFGMANSFATTQSMNSSKTNAGGWTSCALRATIINTLLPAFITAIGANIIKPVTKRTSAGSQSTTINTSTDSLWLLSEYEVFGATTYSVAGEKPTDKSICYPIFTSAASRIKNVGSSAVSWWVRSPYASYSTDFCSVSSWGVAGNTGASNSYGVALGFCV